MHRGTKLFLLIAGVALLAPAGASATKTFSPTSLTFPPTQIDRESPGQSVTYSIDAAEIARTTSPYVDQGFGAQSCPPQGFCDYRFTTTCPVAPSNFAPGNQSCSFTVYFTPYESGTHVNFLHAIPGEPTVMLTGTATTGSSKKKKKCKKKGKKRSASVAKKKCKKKK